MQETDSYVKIDEIKDRILQGDCIKVLESFPSESIKNIKSEDVKE